MEEEIKSLRLQISLNEEVTKEILLDTRNVEALAEAENKAKIYNDAKARILPMGITDKWKNEAAIRNTKYNLRSKFKSSIWALKERIDATNKAIETIESEYDGGLQSRLDVIRGTYEEKKEIIEKILWEREKQKRSLKSDQIAEDRRLMAAIKIQAWWRGKMVKKMCDAIRKFNMKMSKRKLGHSKNRSNFEVSDFN